MKHTISKNCLILSILVAFVLISPAAIASNIINYRIVSAKSWELIIDVNYSYSGNFGSNVYVGVKAAKDGKDLRYFGFRPKKVTGRTGTARITLLTTGSSPASFTSNQLAFILYTSDIVFLKEYFPYKKVWSKRTYEQRTNSTENNSESSSSRAVTNPEYKFHKKGRLVIPQTHLFDLDSGRKTQVGADIWFRAETARLRYLTPRNGAKIALLGQLRGMPSLAQCKASNLSNNRILINAIPKNSWVAVKTNQGRYSAFKVLKTVGPSPGKLYIYFYTWER
ncbi:MAG TPA: hypothetical protein QF753_21555 [Victivallales bacterium]|nr:hypothetical protein [Victivallales bacterium]